MGTHKDKKSGLLLLIAAFAQLIASAAVPPLFSLSVAKGQVVIISTYRELDVRGAINHATLEKIGEGRFAGSWVRVPEYFGQQFDVVLTLAWCVSGLCLATSITLFSVYRRGGDCSRATGGSISQGDGGGSL